jgi:carbamoyl-phosphate synthase large subunit
VPYRFWNAEADEMYPIVRGDDPRFMKFLTRLIHDTRADVVYASDTNEELLQISKNRAEIEDAGARVFMPDHDRVEVFENKWRTYQCLAKSGVRAPETLHITTPEVLRQALERFGRVWLRATYGSGGRASIPTDDLALARSWIAKHDGWGRFTGAEMLTGTSSTWSGLWNNSQLVACQIRKRLFWEFASLSPSGVTGITGAQIISNDPEVHRVALAAIHSADSRPHGIVSVDVTFGADGLPYVTEIQASRYYSSILFLAEAGLNFPDLFVRLAMGETEGLPRNLINPLPTDLMWVKYVDCLPRLVRQHDVDQIERLLEQRLQDL